MQDNSQNADIDLVLEIRPWTFMQSRRSDIHFYYYAVENVPMMFDGFESLPIKIAGKRLGIVIYSDSQRKDFKQLTGVALDGIVLKMQLLQYFSSKNIYPFEVENEEILSNILRDIFAENLKKQDEYAQRERLLTSWFDQEKVTFLNLTGINILESAYFSFYLTNERKININELIDFEEILESKERVISLIGEFYQMEKDKRMKPIKSAFTPPPVAEEVSKKIPLRQIALLYVYDGFLLNDSNCNEEAKKYCWKSGKTLIKHYRSFRDSETNRRNGKTSRQDLEIIIPLLTTEKGKNWANEDFKNTKIPFKEQ